jgi:DSF synthase
MYNAMISPSPSSGPVLASFASAHTPEWLRSAANLPEMGVEYDAAGRVLWQIMRPQGKPSITRGLLCDALIVMDAVAAAPKTAEGYPVAYMVLASGVPGVYNLGGDLALFRQLIVERDAAALTSYAHTCIEVQYRRATRLGLPMCTIALVQGDALGGGFEAALAHDVIVAERSAKFGLPEILFNLFPGMGAYTFLRRRLSPVMAERLMTSGRLYSAEELLDMGVIDMVAEDGAGAEAVRAYIRAHRRAGKSRMAVTRARDIANPVSHRELLGITDLWVETALTLTSQDLRKMDHLVAAQKRRMAA